MILSKSNPDLATRLISIYFSFFGVSYTAPAAYVRLRNTRACAKFTRPGVLRVSRGRVYFARSLVTTCCRQSRDCVLVVTLSELPNHFHDCLHQIVTCSQLGLYKWKFVYQIHQERTLAYITCKLHRMIGVLNSKWKYCDGACV